MNIITSLFLAFGLAMDSFAVSVAAGSSSKQIRFTNTLKIAFVFGFFQALMPVLGWFLGRGFSDFISAIDHWIAFILLCVIGSKMIYDDLSGDDTEDDVGTGEMSAQSLLVLALATSIDALAVGFSLTFLHNILLPVVTIGLITFGLSLFGIYLGHNYKHFGKNKARIIGGIILIGIGSKILLEHIYS